MYYFSGVYCLGLWQTRCSKIMVLKDVRHRDVNVRGCMRACMRACTCNYKVIIN